MGLIISERKIISTETIVILSMLIICAIAPEPVAVQGAEAQTWHLGDGQQLKGLAEDGNDRYLHEVARIKQMVNMGRTESVQKELKKLKADFPEVTGPDLDAFMKAEILFSRGKITKAVRGYEKFLDDYPESDLYPAGLERMFDIAKAFLSGQKRRVLGVFKIRGYAEGERIMEKIVDRSGDSPLALSAMEAVAESYEKRERFNEAYGKWSEISSRWPSGETGKNALFNMARCKHAAYRGPNYDVSNLISAKSYYDNFKERYPEESEKLGIGNIIGQIKEQLAYEKFSIAQYYEKTGNIQQANLYYQMVIDNWPDSTAAKMTYFARNQKDSDIKKKEKWTRRAVTKIEKWFL